MYELLTGDGPYESLPDFALASLARSLEACKMKYMPRPVSKKPYAAATARTVVTDLHQMEL